MGLPRSLAAATAAVFLMASPRLARAGGFDELPDQGAQALGRGAAFTAKADDATALHYNVAGLARQRGTKLQVSGNLQLASISFQRAGAYPDDPSHASTPWGGKAFPEVTNTQASFLLPMMTATTDFGAFDRLTVGVGFWGPSAAGKTFPIGVHGLPSPARYDAVQGSGIIGFPTLGAGVRVTPNIDIGVAAQLVVAHLDALSIVYFDPGGGACKSHEDYGCDVVSRLDVTGVSATGAVGMLARPAPAWQLGAQLRAPAAVKAAGTASERLGATSLPSTQATVTIDFPWVFRAGARYVAMTRDERQRPFEQYDLELDATYETWGATGAVGPTAVIADPMTKKPMSVTIVHQWKNTFSLRAGGAYNIPLAEDATLTLRGGAFYDSPTTDSAYTRIDYNTLGKVAGTLGLGYRTRHYSANLAYAIVGSSRRTVTDGAIQPTNAAKGGKFVDGDGAALGAVNNGVYSALAHVLSFGVEVNFDAFFGERTSTYGEVASR